MTPVPPDKVDGVIADINSILMDAEKAKAPPRLDVMKLGIPSPTLGHDVVVVLSSAFIADLQNWGTTNCVKFRLNPPMPGQP